MKSNYQSWSEQNQNRDYLLEQSKMLQAIIARMDNHSLEVKKFGATIWTALMGFGFSTPTAPKSSLFGLALVTLIFFGFLDVYYLYLEKRFRDKFAQVMDILSKNESTIGDNLAQAEKNFVKLESLSLGKFWVLYLKSMLSWANLPYLVLLVATLWIWRTS